MLRRDSNRRQLGTHKSLGLMFFDASTSSMDTSFSRLRNAFVLIISLYMFLSVMYLTPSIILIVSEVQVLAGC